MKNHAMMWRVLSLGVALLAALSLTFAPVLAPNFNLAPVFAEDDDDDGDDDDNDDRDREGLTKAEAKDIFEECQKASAALQGDSRVLFRPETGLPIFWCAFTNREGKLLLVKATDTGGTPEKPKGSDAARLSIRIAIAKAWTVSFSNNEVAVDSRAVGLNSRIDQTGMFGASGTNAGPASLYGVWVTNLFRSFGGKTGIKLHKRHYGVVPFAGGQPIYTKPNPECGGGVLIGGGGASGDSVDADDAVITAAITNAGFCITP